jgi:AP-3 complex subunit beta
LSVLSSFSIDQDQYQLGTLSHILNNKTTGYRDLPEWPEEAPDPSVRNVELPVPEVTGKSDRKKPTKEKGFYSESESSSEG